VDTGNVPDGTSCGSNLACIAGSCTASATIFNPALSPAEMKQLYDRLK